MIWVPLSVEGKWKLFNQNNIYLGWWFGLCWISSTSSGWVGDNVMLDEEPNLLELFFFYERESLWDILGNKIYPRWLQTFSPFFLLVFPSVAENLEPL